MPPGSPVTQSPAAVPTRREADEVARALLADEGTRLAHVRTAGSVAHRLAILFTEEEAALLVAAATLHDIGYSALISSSGFHPLDGARFLHAEGYSHRLASLVGHHSLAHMTAPAHLLVELEAQFPREDSLLADALAYSDMHSAPDGRLISAQARLAEIATRRPDQAEAERAAQLRAAIARVGTALLTAQARVLPTPREPSDDRAPQPGRVPPHVRSAFESWWRAETRYREAWQEFAEAVPERARPADPADVPAPRREGALALAALRSRADLQRDHYFRTALG
jgi:HD superfamily phosphodiesterase